jgi:shikimate dehydrogenase
MNAGHPYDDSNIRLAVIGDPVEHSLSPAMQGAALAAAGLPWRYQAVRVPPSELADATERLRATTQGFNVTVPHKLTVQQYLDDLAPSAVRVGAVNTVVREGGRLIGHNTDLAGFTHALLMIQPEPEGPAVLFGAGGAARAVALALAGLDMAIIVVNRTADRANVLAASLPRAQALRPDDPALLRALFTARVVVNATSLGLRPTDPSPLLAGARLRPDALAIDLVYGQNTPFLQAARRYGCRAADGVEMLVRQGAESFRLWTGIGPDVEVMRAACRRALEEVHAC